MEIPGISPSSSPRFVLTTEPPNEQDKDEWLRARDEPIPPGTPPELVNKFYDNRAMSINVLAVAMRDTEGFTGVRDVEGNLQAGASITNERDHIYIDNFSTAPWNIFRISPKSVRGAGEALMAEIVKESINRGHGGEIRLNPLSGSVGFYTRIGFVVDEETDEMILTSQSARLFLSDMESR